MTAQFFHIPKDEKLEALARIESGQKEIVAALGRLEKLLEKPERGAGEIREIKRKRSKV